MPRFNERAFSRPAALTNQNDIIDLGFASNLPTHIFVLVSPPSSGEIKCAEPDIGRTYAWDSAALRVRRIAVQVVDNSDAYVLKVYVCLG